MRRYVALSTGMAIHLCHSRHRQGARLATSNSLCLRKEASVSAVGTCSPGVGGGVRRLFAGCGRRGWLGAMCLSCALPPLVRLLAAGCSGANVLVVCAARW